MKLQELFQPQTDDEVWLEQMKKDAEPGGPLDMLAKQALASTVEESDDL